MQRVTGEREGGRVFSARGGGEGEGQVKMEVSVQRGRRKGRRGFDWPGLERARAGAGGLCVG